MSVEQAECVGRDRLLVRVFEEYTHWVLLSLEPTNLESQGTSTSSDSTSISIDFKL